ncbi:MAG: response regulator [Lachnospira sp.]
MNKKILFVGNPSSFITKSIIDALTKEGYECRTADFDSPVIKVGSEDVDRLFVCVDGDISQDVEKLTEIRNVCMEQGKTIFLVGYEGELKRVKEILSSDLIEHEFVRPINSKHIADWFVENEQQESSMGRKKHILIVDDSGTMLHTIKSWLTPKFQVSMANSATNAITFLSMRKPDLILLDYEMPICTGPQLLEMLRAEIDTADIPVIFLTSKGDAKSVQQVLSLNPQGYLLKTTAPMDVVDTIEKYFEQHDNLQ